MKKWVLLDSQDVLNTPYMEVQKRAYELPNGLVVKDYYHLKRPSYILVVARDAGDRILVVRQYRRGIDRVIVELPAGWIDPEETVCEAALRELREETGMEGEQPTEIGSMAAQSSFSDMQGHVVAARVHSEQALSEWSKPAGGGLEADEDIECKFVTAAELNRLIEAGTFCSMGDIAALRMCGL